MIVARINSPLRVGQTHGEKGRRDDDDGNENNVDIPMATSRGEVLMR